MKRKLALIFLCLMLVLSLFALAACGIGSDKDDDDDEKESKHKHDYGAWIDEIPASCTENGTLGHYHCAKCDKDFDADKKELSDIVISASHNFGIWVAETPAFCETEGTLGHYRCSKCNKYFDADKKELSSITVPAPGEHNFVEDACIDCGFKIVYSEGLEFALSQDETYYLVTGIGACEDTDIYIPRVHEGLPVGKIAQFAFEDSLQIKSVFIPSSVTEIESGAFYNCSKIEKITIPDSVVSIGNAAFFKCSNLRSIDLPEGITVINRSLLYGCESLESIILPDSVTSIDDMAFYACFGISSITIPENVTAIGFSVFSNCYKLVEIINKSKCDIERAAYEELKLLDIHSGKSKIDNVDGLLFFTYEGVNYLIGYIGDSTELALPSKYKGEGYEVYNYALYNEDGITELVIPEGIAKFGEYAFAKCDKLLSLSIGSNVEANATSLFMGCKNLASVTVEKGVTSFNTSAFQLCNKVVEVINKSGVDLVKGAGGVTYNAIEIHNGKSKIKLVGDYVFYACASGNYLVNYIGDESEIVLPEDFGGEDYEIYRYAFYENSEIRSVTIPDGVKAIGMYAFSECKNLEDIIIPASVKSIGDRAIYIAGESALSSIKFRGSESEWNSVTKGYQWDMYYSYNDRSYHKIDYTLTYNYSGK